MQRITFLSSGNGGNLKFLHYIQSNLNSPKFVLNVIADRECGATIFAQKNGIECKVIKVKNDDQTDLSSSIAEFKPDIIFTTIHKVIASSVLSLYGERMVNLHYSLLPFHAGVIGMKGVERAIANNDFLLGVSTHKVTSKLDAGPIIVQSHFPNPKDYELSVKASFRIGCLHLWSILEDQKEVDLIVTDKDTSLVESIVVRHSRPLSPLPKFVDEAFWSQLSIL